MGYKLGLLLHPSAHSSSSSSAASSIHQTNNINNTTASSITSRSMVQFPMMKLYDPQSQQQQAAALLAAQQGLQSLLSPPSSGNSSSSGSAASQNSTSCQPITSSVTSYPHAMDCDPPAPHPPPAPLPPPSRYSSSNQGHLHHINSASITGSSAGAGNRPKYQRIFDHLTGDRHVQGSNIISSSSSTSSASSGHNKAPAPQMHSYAPASLPIDLGQSLVATSHLMMTDTNVISAGNLSSSSSSGPTSFSSLYGSSHHLFGIGNNFTDTTSPPSSLINHQGKVIRMNPPAGSGPPSIIGERNSGNPIIGVGVSGGNSGSAGGTNGGDRSSPMVGVCVQQSPVVIH